MPAAKTSPTVLTLLTEAQLRAIVIDAVREVMGASNAAEVMTLDAVAKWLQVTPRAVRNWVKSDGLPALRAGSEYRFQRAAVLAWLEQRAEKPGAHVSKHVERLAAARAGQV